MDDDGQEWVLVEKTDCIDADKTFNGNSPNLDLESDESIVVLDDFTTESNSEVEELNLTTLQPVENAEIATETLIFCENDKSSEICSNQNEVQVSETDEYSEYSEYSESESDIENIHEDLTTDLISCYEFSTRHLSGTNSSLPFYSSSIPGNDKTVGSSDYELSYTTHEFMEKIIHNELVTPESTQTQKIIKLLLGFFLVLLSSSFVILTRIYFAKNNGATIPTDSFFETLDSTDTRAIIFYCTYQENAKEVYLKEAVEKCVKKKLEKKIKGEELTKILNYLKSKERIDEFHTEKLSSKRKEKLQNEKMLKQEFIRENNEYKRKRSAEFKKIIITNNNNNNEKQFMSKNYPKLKGEETCTTKEYKKKLDNSNNNRKRNFYNNNNKKFCASFPSSDSKENRFLNDYNNNNKLKNKSSMKEHLKLIKNKMQKLFKKNSKKYNKDKSAEEWYIKYNPIKDTIEIINITTLSEEDSYLIKNGNKTINGQWYFSLGIARANLRSKEKTAEWYFKRSKLREITRNKAKWYFDYMSARDDSRVFY